MPDKKACLCSSGVAYAVCCKPIHHGIAAPSPEALMRSRYTAFALGLGEYLYDTLASGHADRRAPRDVAAIELSRMKHHQRFLGLQILHAEAPAAGAASGEVLFFAKVFSKGEDFSFAELSHFVREDGSWKYESGLIIPKAELPDELPTNLELFMKLAERVKLR